MRLQTTYRPMIALNENKALSVIVVVLASIVLALISQIALHLWWPVPITLQSAMVVMLGLTLGSKRAAAAVALYLLEGAVGLPVFAGGLSGVGYLVGASAGYLWGFLPAAFIAGILMEKGFAKNYLLTFLAAVIAASAIFLVGYLHLAVLMGFSAAYRLGILPFIIIEPLKLLIAAGIAKPVWRKL